METTPAKTGKKRFLNFTEEEKAFLLFYVQKHKDVIDSKDVSAASCLRKKNAWTEITKAFNEEPGNTKRNTKQLQKLFFNLKDRRKKKLAKGGAKKNQLLPFEKKFCKKSMSDTGDSDEFSEDSNDEDFTDGKTDDDSNDLVNSTVHEPLIKLEPMKRKYNESAESKKSLHKLKMKEAEIRLMIANEQLEEAKIKKQTAGLVQQFEIKYYEEKIRTLNHFHSGNQFQLQ